MCIIRIFQLVRLTAILTVNLQVGEHIATRKRCIKSLINIIIIRLVLILCEVVKIQEMFLF